MKIGTFFKFVKIQTKIASVIPMVKDNISNLEDDKHNKRYTLPYYIGKNNGLKLFALHYILSYMVIILSVIFKILPLLSLLVLITGIPIFKNIKQFFVEQKKETTFVLSVKNFVSFSVIRIISFSSYIGTKVIGMVHNYIKKIIKITPTKECYT